MNNFFSTSYNRTLATLALVFLVIALASYAYYTIRQSEYMYMGPTTISVSGEGEVMATPDIGKFSFTVSESAEDSAIAIKNSGEKVSAILAALKEAGVEEKDIKTEYYNLYPKYKYVNQVCPVGTYCPGEQVADGFEVTQNIAVKVRDLDKTGTMLSLASEKGATNLSSLEFTIDDTDALKELARADAIKDAKAKAEELAASLDVKLIKMVGYFEDENMPTPYFNYGMGGDMMMKSESSSFIPEVPVGENITKSRVTLTYQIK
jgi:uncharacterized protein YggE